MEEWTERKEQVTAAQGDQQSQRGVGGWAVKLGGQGRSYWEARSGAEWKEEREFAE